MRHLRVLLPAAAALCGLAQTYEVGSGAPNEALRQRFISAFFRNGFYTLVSLPPLGPVRSFGGTGLIQLFRSASNPNDTLAIVKANPSTAYPPAAPGEENLPIDTFQVLAAMYAYYNQIGVGTAGFPTTDTRTCPATAAGACQYQLFDKNYALFVYSQGPAGEQNFLVRDPFYTSWNSLGGISTLGPAAGNQTAVTSSSGTTGAFQAFANGALVQISSGTYSGRMFAVQQPVWDLYVYYGTYSGLLGFPISEEVTLADGRRRQNFEGGSVEYALGAGVTLRLPVAYISIQPAATPLRMNLGDSVSLRATLYAANGAELTDRAVNWSTSNGRVVSLQASGAGVTLKAVGGGVAVIQATSEGKNSLPITVVVTAPCCQVGEGAPTAAIQQAFEDAVTRNRLALRLPTPSPVRRAGNGYLQEFTDASGERCVIAKGDRFPAAYLLRGALLSRWEALGGPTGSLGYPSSDATPGGRQMFENGAALAGAPVRIVSGTILAKWAALGYEAGVAGPPLAEAAQFLTFTGTAGDGQTFRDGAIYAARTGSRAGQAWLVRGLMLAKYAALRGPAGELGLPVSDEFQIEGRNRQQFEGGELEYGPLDSEARAALKPRRPLVSATPAVVTPGNRVRIVVGGFPPGAAVRVSLTGRPDFEVRTETGAYSWEQYVPPGAASGKVLIRATSGEEAAEGGYQIKALVEQRVELRKTQGDAQSGPPGALLPQPLRVALRDEFGNPMAGVTVRFTASPGAQVTPASAVTDAAGAAEARLRLPASEGVALVTAEALRQVVTFSARAAAGSLSNFPRFIASGSSRLGPGPGSIGEQGALLAAAASILRYYQNLGALPAANGLAEPALLNQYLTGLCTLDAQGIEICDGFLAAPGSGEPVVNLWRLAGFVSGNLEVGPEKTDPASLRDLLAQDSPVLAALALSADGQPMGAHFVVAVGVRADGAVLIHDPNPVFGRATLEEYLTGFALGGRNWKGAVTSALRLLPRSAAPTGFLVTAGEVNFQLDSAAGACGQTLEWPATAATGAPPQGTVGVFRARYCEGSGLIYQLDVDAQGTYRLTVTDLGNLGSRFEISGGGPSAYRLERPAGRLAVAPQQISIQAGGVVNAASFTSSIAPGGLVALFGSGLARAGGKTEVEIGGVQAPVLAAGPFQVNVQAPLGLAPGDYRLRIRSPYGEAEQTVTLQPWAPAIFQLEGGLGAILNQDGTLNQPGNPAGRGQVVVVYCTGLGEVERSGSLMPAVTPVTALLDGVELEVAFAGLAPGFRGLYQVNVALPPSLPPRLDATLRLRQGGVLSNAVALALQ